MTEKEKPTKSALFVMSNFCTQNTVNAGNVSKKVGPSFRFNFNAKARHQLFVLLEF